MRKHVEIAISADPIEQAAETAKCLHCGQRLEYDTNAIGQLVEKCTGCGHSQVFRGAPLRTRQHLIDEGAMTKRGDFRQSRGDYTGHKKDSSAKKPKRKKS